MDNLNGKQFLFDEAKNYADMGLPVGPAEGKAIKINGWSKLQPEDFLSDNTYNFWKNATGIGIVCGESSGIICLDIDIDKSINPELIDEITSKIPPILSGKIGNPNRRPAQFFKYNGEQSRKFNNIGVEILSTGNQTIIPPSKHPKFEQYQWVGTPLHKLSDIDELPVLPSGFIDWLIEKNQQHATDKTNAETPVTEKSTGRCSHGSHNTISALAYALFKQNYPFDLLLDRILKRDKELNYGADYLYFNCPSRPWKHKDTVKNAKDFLAEMFKRHETDVIEANPIPKENVESNENKEKKKEGITLLPLGELLSRPDEAIPYLVENLLPAGGTSIMAAKPKVGKTTLLRQLSLCVARGEMFLNRGCSKGPVIYFSVEEKIDEIKSHFRDMGADGKEEIYIFAERAPKDTIQQLKPLIIKIKPSLIILDTLFKVIRMKDENSYAAISDALEPVQELARESGAHIMCVHHAGKADREGGDGILGSTAILGAFDTAIIMTRNDKKRTIKTIQRYGTDLDESVLHWNKDTRMSSLGQENWKERSDERSKEILDFIRNIGQKVSFEDIKSGTGIDRKILRDALNKMVDLKLLGVSGLGIRGNPKMYSTGLF